MRRLVVLMLVVLTSAGCAAAVRWEKAGATEAERQRNQTECASRASLESSVPAAQSGGTSYGTPADPQRVSVRPYDSELFDECMRTRGYARVPPRPSS